MIGDAVNLCSRVEAATRETGDPVLITGDTRALLSETIEVEPRGEREIRGYDRKVELYAPLVPVALAGPGPGTDVNDPLGDPVVGGLGRAPVAGRRPRPPGRPGPGVGSRHRPGARPRPDPHAARLLEEAAVAHSTSQWAAAHPGGDGPPNPLICDQSPWPCR